MMKKYEIQALYDRAKKVSMDFEIHGYSTQGNKMMCIGGFMHGLKMVLGELERVPWSDEQVTGKPLSPELLLGALCPDDSKAEEGINP